MDWCNSQSIATPKINKELRPIRLAQELETPRALHNRVVRHWGRVWLGRPVTNDGRTRVYWVEQQYEVEVSKQEYGEPRWMEGLQADMISAARQCLHQAPDGFDSVRIRVSLYTHQSDGSNQKFTLEHIERPDYIA